MLVFQCSFYTIVTCLARWFLYTMSACICELFLWLLRANYTTPDCSGQGRILAFDHLAHWTPPGRILSPVHASTAVALLCRVWFAPDLSVYCLFGEVIYPCWPTLVDVDHFVIFHFCCAPWGHCQPDWIQQCDRCSRGLMYVTPRVVHVPYSLSGLEPSTFRQLSSFISCCVGLRRPSFDRCADHHIGKVCFLFLL